MALVHINFIWINDCCNVITKTNIADFVHRNRCIDQRSCDDLVGDVVFLLVGLFPPIGILLSAIFFLLNIGTFTKNWRMTLVGIYFYFYPFGVMALSEVMHWDNHWFIAGSLLLGLILLHVMLTKLYQHYGIGRTIFWYVFSIPFALLTALLPSRLKTKIKGYHKIK